MSRADLLGSLPWLVAAFGLVVTHLLSEARERRKESRAQLDKIVERLQSLEHQGFKFHTATAFDFAAARTIETEVAAIERRVVRLLPQAAKSLEEIIIDHRQGMTLKNFDASTFVPQLAGSAVLSEISATTAEYEEALEAAYVSQYPPHFPYYRVGSSGLTSVLHLVVSACAGALISGALVYLAMQP